MGLYPTMGGAVVSVTGGGALGVPIVGKLVGAMIALMFLWYKTIFFFLMISSVDGEENGGTPCKGAMHCDHELGDVGPGRDISQSSRGLCHGSKIESIEELPAMLIGRVKIEMSRHIHEIIRQCKSDENENVRPKDMTCARHHIHIPWAGELFPRHHLF